MPKARRPVIRDEEVLRVLAHPVRLNVLNHLMSTGPATASACARAVGDTPSNCSYHLRTLAKVGLVAADDSTDARERPWRATITGFSVADDSDGTEAAGVDPRAAAAVNAAALQLDQRDARLYLAHRSEIPPAWREVDAFARYGLSVSPDELADIVARIDAIVRPYLAATRDDSPSGAESVRFAFQAFAPAPSAAREKP